MVWPGGLGVAVGHPDHDRLLQPEHVAEVDGKSASIGSSVEPGLPNIVVIPCARKRSNVASRTVGIGRTLSRAAIQGRGGVEGVDSAGVRNRPFSFRRDVERIASPLALACAALLCLAAPRAWPAGPTATRLVYAAGKIVPIPASIPHEAGDMVDQRILPDLRWIAQRYPIYVTDGYSGPLPSGEHAGCDELPHQRLRPLQRPRRRPRAAGRRRRNATPPGRRSPASPSGPSRSRTSRRSPFRWVGYDGDAGHGCGNHLHLSWNHAPAPAVPARRMGRSLPGRPSSKPAAKSRAASARRRPKPPPGPSGGISTVRTGGLGARASPTERAAGSECCPEGSSPAAARP